MLSISSLHYHGLNFSFSNLPSFYFQQGPSLPVLHTQETKELEADRWDTTQLFPFHPGMHACLALKYQGVKDTLTAGAGPESLVHAPAFPAPLHPWPSHLYPWNSSSSYCLSPQTCSTLSQTENKRTKLPVDHVSFPATTLALSSLYMSPNSQLDFCLHFLLPLVHLTTYWPVSLAVS